MSHHFDESLCHLNVNPDLDGPVMQCQNPAAPRDGVELCRYHLTLLEILWDRTADSAIAKLELVANGEQP